MNATLRLMLSALALGVALAATHANAAEDQKAKSETVTLKITGMT